jgi:integrase
VSGGRKNRSNGEGSIFPYRNGYAAYVWVTTPAGTRQRKYVYGKTREIAHGKWLELHRQAKAGPVASRVPTLAAYVTYWLADIVLPNLAPATAANYDMFARLYIVPDLGEKRLDKLSVRDVQTWLNRLRERCQCCAQEKDVKRGKPRCCAVGKCCDQRASDRTIRDAWATLRIVLGNAVREELLSRNVAGLVKVPKARSRRAKPWTVDEARRFLESARADGDALYAAYVLILVLGLRRGEVLGLAWDDVDVDAGEVYIAWQVQRIGGKLLRRQTKTEASDAPLPLPDICMTALKERRERQDRWRDVAGSAWQGGELVVSTRYGLPVDPRNFHREFKTRCTKAGVRPIPVHSTRRTCASLLVALDVHPRVAMQIMRHSQIAVTMNIYSEVSSAETREALRMLGAELGPRK